MKREIVEKRVGGIELYELEGTIEHAIHVLEKVRDKNSGEISCSLKQNYDYDPDYDDTVFRIVVEREETVEEQKVRLSRKDVRDKLEKEQRRGNYMLLKEEFEGDGNNE